MIKKYLITLVLLSIPISFMSINAIKLKKAQPLTKPIYNKDMSSPFKDFESPVKLEFKAKNPNIMANDIAGYKIKQKEIKAEEDRLKKEAELKEQKEIEERQSKTRNIVSRGGELPSAIVFEITHYSTLREENGGHTVTCNGVSLDSIQLNTIVASNYYPQGTKIYLEGIGIVEVGDKGGNRFNSYNKLDLLVPRLKNESVYQYKKRTKDLGIKKVKGAVVKSK